jgi:hypothetical protein
MNLKRFLFLFVVTTLTLAGGATVTTPAAAQTAPLQCEWPVTGNLLPDGMLTSGNSSHWGNINPYLWGVVGAISDHPCGYTNGLLYGQADAIVNYDQSQDVLFSGWMLRNGDFTPEFQLRSRAYTSGVGYYDYGAEVIGDSAPAGDWGFVQVCIPGAEYNNETYHLYINQFPVGDTTWTGLSLVPWQCEPEGTPTSTSEPTAVLTSTPTATGTVTPIPTATIAITATVTAIYIVSTIAPVPTLPASSVYYPPVPTLTPYPLLPPPAYTTTTPITATLPLTIPSFYADLPNLPSPVTIGNNLGVEAEIAWPEWTVADGQQILVLPVSVVSYIAESEWWEIINYGIHVIIAVLGLIRISTMF